MPPIPDSVAQTSSRMVENGGYGAALIILAVFAALGWFLYIRSTLAMAKLNGEVQGLALDSARASDRAVPVLSDVKSALLIIADRLRK